MIYSLFTSGYLPNGIHAVEAMLAAASIGAIWSSTSPDFGVNVRALHAQWLLFYHMSTIMHYFFNHVKYTLSV